MRADAIVRRCSLADGEPAPDALEAPPAGTPLVLLIDDAHLLRDQVLDRIEHLTLDTDNAPIWIAVSALPRLEEVRPRWGMRANRHERVTLRPLDEADAMALSAELLLPAEYPPADFLRALVAW